MLSFPLSSTATCRIVLSPLLTLITLAVLTKLSVISLGWDTAASA